MSYQALDDIDEELMSMKKTFGTMYEHDNKLREQRVSIISNIIKDEKLLSNIKWSFECVDSTGSLCLKADEYNCPKLIELISDGYHWSFELIKGEKYDRVYIHSDDGELSLIISSGLITTFLKEYDIKFDISRYENEMVELKKRVSDMELIVSQISQFRRK